MKTTSILKRIGTRESMKIEWKPSLSQINEIVESVTAFANTEGGRIFIGVSKTSNVLGVSIGKDTIENLTNRIAQHTEPKIHPRITVVKVQGKEIIVIDVKESRGKLILADGRPYVRVGKSTRQMSKDEYERLILEKDRESHPFDAEVCIGASLSDIDVAKVRRFVSSARQERGLDINEKGSTKDILMRLKMLKKDKPTNGAILLFGKDPGKFFEQSEVKCVRFKGTDVTGEMIDLKPVHGDAIDLVKECEKFIYDHIPMRAWIESGKLERQEKWLYPPKAIREALANAIAHRDYQTTSKVQVRIFDDRIEFWNPGHLPPGWTPETLKKTHESKPRNPSIAKAFFWIRYAEEVGTGTNKIIFWCKEWGLPEPEFEYTGTAVVVTLKKALAAVEKEGGEVREKTREKSKEKSKEKILRLMAEKPEITTQEIAEAINLSLAGVEKAIRSLKKQGRLSRVGPDKGGHWEVRD